MSKTTLNIITPCSRPDNIFDLYESIKGFVKKEENEYNIYWYIIYDGTKVPQEKQFKFNEEDPWIIEGTINESSVGYPQRNFALSMIKDGWVWVLDDDNIMHPNFYSEVSSHFEEDLNGMIVDQIDKWNNLRLSARPDRVKVCHIDMAQYILKREYIGEKKFNTAYCSDGVFIEELYKSNPSKYLFINKPLTYYNYLRS